MAGQACLFYRNALKEALPRGSVEHAIFVPHALHVRVFSETLVHRACLIIERVCGIPIAFGQLLNPPAVFLSKRPGPHPYRLTDPRKRRLIDGLGVVHLTSERRPEHVDSVDAGFHTGLRCCNGNCIAACLFTIGWSRRTC